MKKIVSKIWTLLPTLLFLVGCTNTETNFDEQVNGTLTLTVLMPNDDMATRVGVSSLPNSKNLAAQWNETDEVQIIITQTDQKYEVGKIKVSNLSQAKDLAKITFNLPEPLDIDKPYTIYAFSGILGSVEKDEKGQWQPTCKAELKRQWIGQFNDVPVYCKVQVTKNQIPSLHFEHFGTCEVLHITNTSSSLISFKHSGYATDNNKWYWNRAVINLNNGGITPEDSGENEKSYTQNIHSGVTALYVSWYLPTGYKMDKARLKAIIDGKEVVSENTKTSDVTPERGRAYHLYATWDGKELTFDNGDHVEISTYVVSHDEIDFGKTEVGETRQGYFVIQNTGNIPLKFFVEATHGDFEIEKSGKTIELLPYEKSHFLVSFTPTEFETNYEKVVRIFCYGGAGNTTILLKGYTEKRIDQVIPEDIRDLMEPHIHIYEGNNPPNVEGQFLISPLTMTHDSKGSWEVGEVFYDSYIRLYNQNRKANTIDFYKEQGGGKETGEGAFISGEGNNFSIYFKTSGYSPYKDSDFKVYLKRSLIISGTMTTDGIKNLEYAFVIVEKSDDPKNQIMDVGDFRSFKDGDGFSPFYQWYNNAKVMKIRANQRKNSLPMLLDVANK